MKPDISVIIPVLNEQKVIPRVIEALYHQRFSGTFEIIVVDGSKEGSTIKCIGNKDVLTLTSTKGRGCQMNSGAKIAKAEILIFLHCDTRLPENGLTQVKTAMKNPFVKAGAFDLAIKAEGFAYRVIEKTASLRSRITKIPYGDQAIFIRKNYFFDMGQYREIPIMEDVDLMMRIRKDGKTITLLKSRTTTSSRRWEKEGIVFCTLRNWMILSLFFLGVTPEKLAAFYRHHNA